VILCNVMKRMVGTSLLVVVDCHDDQNKDSDSDNDKD